MSTNDTVRMQAGILVMGYDARTASFTVQVLSNSAGLESVRDATAVISGYDDAQDATDFADEPSAGPRPVCAASVQHNFRAGPHPGVCKHGRNGRR